MSNSQSNNVQEAIEIFARRNSLTVDAMRELAQRLDTEGESDYAQKIRMRADEDDAIAILRGVDATPDVMLKLAKRLAGYKQIGYGRRVLQRARTGLKKHEYPKEYLEIFQKSALYTYKDPDLPVDWRLDRALEILKEPEDLAETRNQETLGLAGAIYKRKWDVDGQRQHLERSLLYYLKGYAQGAPTEEGRADILQYLQKHPTATLRADEDRGYTGINAAFMLDLLAQQEEEEAKKANLPSETADKRREDARRIRQEIIRSVPPLKDQPDNAWLAHEWWFYSTIGEAYFGLECYDEALEWLVTKPAAARLQVPEWEYESTARQLARLAILKHDSTISEADFAQTEAGKTLKIFLQNDDTAVRSAFRGKFGLALSGGGFRASLYHIGVLARLAELDVLRHVEVLSCVSGGSVIGAHYYLKLRHLLETKTDADIQPEDYIKIVQEIEDEFLQGVRTNIRTRVLAEFTTNLKLIFWPGYSRTMRVGELYERKLFSRVQDGQGVVEGPHWLPDWLARFMKFKREPRWLNELYICPCIGPNRQQTDFRPKDHNWRRKHKAPILILNATTLNTGHAWHFTASYMGEPPSPINTDIDSNYRLRRMYYNDAPDRHRKIRLGYAVAASSCVPGLFEPLILDDLYPDRSVRLVDGGVCDNQGVMGLLEQDCTVLLVSDGSGQMEAQHLPGNGILSVPLRSNSILMARVREAQYTDVSLRQRSSLLRGLMFVHLKQDLPGDAVAWKDCPAHLKASDFERRLDHARDMTYYNVATDVQQQLAAIRTDLDSFSDAEAYALMASGYQMTAAQFEGPHKCVDGFPAPQQSSPWRFRAVASDMTHGGKNKKHLENLLSASSSAAFKIWKQWLPLKILAVTLLVAVVVLIVWAFYYWRHVNIISALNAGWIRNLTLGSIGVAILWAIGFAILSAVIAILVGRAHGRHIMRLVRWRSTLYYIAVGIGMSLIGWLLARLHLHVFDRLYLRHGKLDKFPP